MTEVNWDKLNEDKRRDILWCASWNQAATLYSGKGNETDLRNIKEAARYLFDEMIKPYKAKKTPKGMTNIDSEITIEQNDER